MEASGIRIAGGSHSFDPASICLIATPMGCSRRDCCCRGGGSTHRGGQHAQVSKADRGARAECARACRPHSAANTHSACTPATPWNACAHPKPVRGGESLERGRGACSYYASKDRDPRAVSFAGGRTTGSVAILRGGLCSRRKISG